MWFFFPIIPLKLNIILKILTFKNFENKKNYKYFVGYKKHLRLIFFFKYQMIKLEKELKIIFI